ncbi:MAG: hypothetical protein EOO45_14840 [Flavobacterium sp.]|nr:MAG: hypothetical protein EOO45_14840 [Flavobacterium sp.]
MKDISTYFSSIFLLLLSVSAFSQGAGADTVAAPPKIERYGLRVGADLHRLTKSFYDDDYRGFEIVGDYRFGKKLYLAGEFGNEEKTVNDPQVNFTTKGTYFKVGVDYNFHKNWLGLENMIYGGVRYGVSSFTQNLNSYQIYNPSGYFDEVTVRPNQEFSGLSAQWAELVFGIKAEVLSNLYLGFSFRLNHLVSNKRPDNFDNLFIPGFNRTYDGNIGVGFNYSLSYFIPLYKTTEKAKTKEDRK